MDTESEKPGGAIASGNKPGAACPVPHRANGAIPGKSAAMEWLENPQICPGVVAAAAPAPSGSRLRGPSQDVTNGARVSNPAPGSAQPSQNQERPLRLDNFLGPNQSVAYPPQFASSSRAVNR